MTLNPDTHETSLAVQRQLVAGERGAQFFPSGHKELPLPKGLQRLKTTVGSFHYDRLIVTPKRIHDAIKARDLDSVLRYGPASNKAGTRSKFASGGSVGSRPVTDPALLAQLKAGSDDTKAESPEDWGAFPVVRDHGRDAGRRGTVPSPSPGFTVEEKSGAGNPFDQFDPDAYLAGKPAFDPSKPFDKLPDAPWAKSGAPPFDSTQPYEALPDAPWAQKGPPKGYVEKALEPVTSYPETYNEMNQDARRQVGHGVDQIRDSANHSFTSRESPDSYLPEGLTEAAKGIGNTAAGALSYVSSPLSAALRTVVGKPIEENIGIPKEYSEFAASLALPGAGMTKLATPVRAAKPLTAADEVAAASGRLGVPIPRAAVTESLPTQQIAGALKEIPVVGTPLVKASKNALEGLDTASRDTAAAYGSTEPLTAGEAATEGIKNWITGKSSDVAKRMYDRVDDLVDPDHVRPLHATQNVVSDIMAKRANARIGGTSRAVDEVRDAIADPDGLNYSGIKDLRTHLRDMTPDEMVAKGISQAEAKRIYGGLTEDMRGTVLDAGGPDGLSAFDKANHVYDLIAAKRGDLSKIIGVKADAAPEDVFKRVLAKASSKGGADYQALVQARRAMGPDSWNEVTSAAVNQMGRAAPEADFSGDRFVTAWNNLSPNGKKVLFNSTGRDDLAQSIDDIMTLSKSHKQLMRYGNPSGTGRVGALTAAAAAAWAAPLTTLATAVGGRITAGVLASPVAAKSAATWSKAYAAAAAQQSYGAMKRLNAASTGLSLALSRNFGVDASDAMRRLQGAIPSTATNENRPMQRAGNG